MDKEYEIRTIKDVVDCVTSDNIDNFIQDFKTYLEMHLAFQSLANAVAEVEGVPQEIAEIQSKFNWIDDGKQDHKIIMLTTKQ